MILFVLWALRSTLAVMCSAYIIYFSNWLVGDEKGQIIAWRYAEGNVFGGCPVQEHIFTMALSYLTEGELAVG